ncbi:MAG: hypothetical protein BMS9Abin05_1027 [Rhodothermia bacterium]|nr:MAG: hypothetical protein BMS9Abin05_1027 [Rhodothermia bacterium]
MLIRNLFKSTSGNRPVDRLVSLLLLLSPMLGLACGTVNPQRESLAEYYWESQNLRFRGGSSTKGAEALRDLGVIYLRTGHYQKAYDVLSRSLVQDRSDPKRWFYAGLAQELLGREDAALSTYERFLSLSSTSIYTRAMRGRAAWLQDAATRDLLYATSRDTDTQRFGELVENRYAVFPLECVSDTPEYKALGTGLSDIISNDLESLRNVDMIDPHLVRMAYAAAEEAVNRAGTSRPVWAGKTLGASRIVGGTCRVDSDETIDVDLILRDLASDEVYSVSGRDRVQNIATLEQSLIRDLATQLRIWIPDREGYTTTTLPTFDALIFYSDGIVSEDSGALETSLAAYDRALAAHPTFVLADVRRIALVNKLLARSTGQDDLVDLVVRLESANYLTYNLDMRINQLGFNVGSTLVPSQDTRKLPPGNLGELPTPPSPVRN